MLTRMMKLQAQPQTSKIIRAFVATYHAFIQDPQTSGFWLSTNLGFENFWFENCGSGKSSNPEVFGSNLQINKSINWLLSTNLGFENLWFENCGSSGWNTVKSSNPQIFKSTNQPLHRCASPKPL